MEKLKDGIAKSEADAKGLKEEQKNIKKRQAALEKELEKEEKNVKKFQEMPTKCENETVELNEKLEQLQIDEQNQKKDYDKAIEEVEAKTKDLRKQKAPLEKKLLEIQKYLNRLMHVFHSFLAPSTKRSKSSTRKKPYSTNTLQNMIVRKTNCMKCMNRSRPPKRLSLTTLRRKSNLRAASQKWNKPCASDK